MNECSVPFPKLSNFLCFIVGKYSWIWASVFISPSGNSRFLQQWFAYPKIAPKSRIQSPFATPNASDFQANIFWILIVPAPSPPIQCIHRGGKRIMYSQLITFNASSIEISVSIWMWIWIWIWWQMLAELGFFTSILVLCIHQHNIIVILPWLLLSAIGIIRITSTLSYLNHNTMKRTRVGKN